MYEKRKRIVDKKLLKSFKDRHCIICYRNPAEGDHIYSKGSGGDDTEQNVWPLCRSHHIERHALGLKRFAIKYPKVLAELKRRGFTELVEEIEELINGKV